MDRRKLVAIVAVAALAAVVAGWATFDQWAGFVGPLVQAVLN